MIGAVGALVGASGAITGGIAVERFNDQITRKQSTQAELRGRHDNLWNSHQLADAREKHAEIVYIEAVTQDDNGVSGVLAEIADRHYYDAWITMGQPREETLSFLLIPTRRSTTQQLSPCRQTSGIQEVSPDENDQPDAFGFQRHYQFPLGVRGGRRADREG